MRYEKETSNTDYRFCRGTAGLEGLLMAVSSQQTHHWHTDQCSDKYRPVFRQIQQSLMYTSKQRLDFLNMLLRLSLPSVFCYFSRTDKLCGCMSSACLRTAVILECDIHMLCVCVCVCVCVRLHAHQFFYFLTI
jgi:hypothetical protein